LATVTQPGTTSVQPPPNLKARLKEAYDAITPTYNQWTFMHRAHRLHYVEALIRLLQADQAERHKNGGSPPDPELLTMREGVQVISLRGMQALEVGCGSGVPVIEVLLAKDLDVIGVDLSGAQLELARTHFPLQTTNLQAVWAEKDMMDLRYPPDEFDVILGLYSLIHLPREEQTVFLHRAVRWLKPGGLILMNFARDELEGEVNERWLGHEKGWMFWSSWGEEKSVRMIEGLGFEVLVREVTGLGGGEEDVADAAFVWVIARKRLESPSPEPPVESEEQVAGPAGEE
jgi:2-polyprenyl-3-methyl-5-hydroxy-6-metoxy-1,4-benzoquinol methylase